jgi:hypothetical protein
MSGRTMSPAPGGCRCCTRARMPQEGCGAMQTAEQRRAARQQRREQRRVDRAMTFNQCPLCSYDLATGEGERAATTTTARTCRNCST